MYARYGLGRQQNGEVPIGSDLTPILLSGRSEAAKDDEFRESFSTYFSRESIYVRFLSDFLIRIYSWHTMRKLFYLKIYFKIAIINNYKMEYETLHDKDNKLFLKKTK